MKSMTYFVQIGEFAHNLDSPGACPVSRDAASRVSTGNQIPFGGWASTPDFFRILLWGSTPAPAPVLDSVPSLPPVPCAAPPAADSLFWSPLPTPLYLLSRVPCASAPARADNARWRFRCRAG